MGWARPLASWDHRAGILQPPDLQTDIQNQPCSRGHSPTTAGRSRPCAGRARPAGEISDLRGRSLVFLQLSLSPS